MLDKLFMTILDLTKTGSIVILAVIAVRFLLKKAPKVISEQQTAIPLVLPFLTTVTKWMPVSLRRILPPV